MYSSMPEEFYFPSIERTWPKLPIAVLVSGSGTNLQAIIDSSKSGMLHAEIRLVISNKPNVYAIERSRQAGIRCEVIEHKRFGKDRAAFEQEMANLIDSTGARLVVLAGFMRILSSWFVNHYNLRIINIHPALLPAFPGVDAQTQAFEYGVKVSGCTTHFVDEKEDHGPIILQQAVPVFDTDSRDELQQRILEYEHKILPASVQLFADGRLRVEGRKVFILPPESARGWLGSVSS